MYAAMSVSGRSRLALLASVVVVALSAGRACTQTDVVDPAKGTLPNPNPTVIKNWGQLPDGRTWGSTAGVDIGPDGHVWAYDRCGTNTCADSKLAPIFKFDRSSGKVLASFGGGMILFPHGLHVVKEWGKLGSRPGEFRTPHALAFDSKGRLFVADRGNHRIQIFDQDGKVLGEWKQFSRVSGLFIDKNDRLYAIDSESSAARHPNWKTGVRIGSTSEDKVLAFIPPHQNQNPEGAAGEGVAVDPDGNVYAAEGPISRPVAGGGLTKYVKRTGS